MPVKFNRIIYTATLLAVSISATSRGMNYFSKGNFYGHTTTFTYDSDMLYTYNDNIKGINAQVDDFMSKINKSDLNEVIRSIDKHAADFELDDMGYLMLAKSFISVTFKNKSQNFKAAILWSIFHTKGFDVIIGVDKNSITTYGLTNGVYFGTPFVKLNNKRFYDLNFKEDHNRSLTKIYKGHERREEKRESIKISYFKPPKLAANIGYKSYNFNYGNVAYHIKGSINQSITEYLKDLPIIAIGSIYINYGFSLNARETIVSQLTRIVNNKPTFEQLNILLKFVQEAIPYKSDQDYLGKEDYAFPEETLLSQYSDCEDKAMLYATLVKDILGIDAVAIYYKDLEHVNVALKMPSVNSNYSFLYKNEPYIICEPASNGLRVGETHQEYVDGLSTDKIIPLY